MEQMKPVEGPFADELLFLPVHGIEGPSHLLGAAGLYLGEDQGVTIPADQIDLSTVGGTEVPTKDFPPKALQVSRRLSLPPSSKD